MLDFFVFLFYYTVNISVDTMKMSTVDGGRRHSVCDEICNKSSKLPIASAHHHFSISDRMCHDPILGRQNMCMSFNIHMNLHVLKKKYSGTERLYTNHYQY